MFLFHTRFRVKPCLAHFHPANCMAVVFLAAAQHNILAGAVFHHSVRTGFQWGCFQRLFNLHAKPRQVFRCRRVGCFDPCTIIFAVIAAARFPRPHGLIILPRFFCIHVDDRSQPYHFASSLKYGACALQCPMSCLLLFSPGGKCRGCIPFLSHRPARCRTGWQ